ncbi:MAG: MG2 domain-containing protein, partial [Flavobacteriaceae bacterium]
MKKKLPILFMIFLFSTTINAQEDFKNLWSKVQRFEVDNLPKSALKIVEEIYVKAKNENNSPQLIKTLFYKSKFALILEEDAQLNVINEFKKHISENEFPTKNVLENVLGNLYWQYFQQNRWKFYQRTKTATKVDETDFRTWDLNTLFSEIHTNFQASLKDRLLLQQINIYDFADILQVQKNSKTYRPSLFDFLAHNALDFYKTSENNITKPAYQFKIDNPKLLDEARAFSVLNITTKDNLSLQFNALKIYQDLIAAHINDKNLHALATVDLERLQFVNQHAIFDNKKQLFLKTLKSSKETYKNNEVSGLYAFEIAQIFHQQANSYASNKNEENRFKNKEAIVICNAIIKQFPKSLGAKKCKQLKTQIEQESLSITSEKFVPTNTNSRLLINYRNIDKLYFTTYKINQKQLRSFYRIYKDEAKVKFIKKLEKATSWNAKLRNEHDYLQHTTEVIVPKLNRGSYLIVATKHNALNSKELFGTSTIQSTNLALVENTFDGKYTYQVVDRNTGKPIKNAKINIKNYRVNRYNKSINRNLTTDKNGFASFKSYHSYNSVVATITYKKEQAFFGDYYLYNQNRNNNYGESNETIIKPFIFTDRSIYRPGQTVHFKVIVLKKKGDQSEVFTNEYIEVTLNDVNNQKVKTLDLKLNEFGSTSGQFIIPNNGLTGEYSIEVDEGGYEIKSKFYDNDDYDWYFDDDNELTFSVEEYKRPKFETQFKPITKTYKINDSVTVNGFAKSFSGTNITDAKVVYRVHRKVQYPSWWYWRRPSFSSEAQEITHGESITDSSGNFSIQFKAVPDESVSKESLPVFTYEITADVTDLNGETRSETTIVKVGYHSLLANLSIADKIDKDSKNEILKITTENLNGEFVPANGRIKIYKLQAPKNSLRNRVWSAPDYQDISESEFRKLFPNEPYSDEESNVNNWKKGKLVFETKFDTKQSKEINLSNIKDWTSGKYIAVLESKDRYNQAVKDQQRFNVFSNKDKKVSDNQLFVIRTNKNSYKSNEDVTLQLGSASKDITVVIQVEKNHKIVETCLVHLKNQIKTLKIPVQKKDIGGFAIKYHFVNLNSFESGNLFIDVPKEQNKIEIETNIFRDKLQPGQDETWSFTIKNDKNDKVAAEVLASMYDASLDQFKSHNWQFNPLTQKRYYSYNRSSANQSFGTNYFQVRNNRRNYFNLPTQRFDSYNWFGFSFSNNKWKQRTYLNQVKRDIVSTRSSYDKIITGTVKDDSGVLPGVSVTIKGTSFGTETDFDGQFSIKVKNTDVLVFSFLGMKTKEITTKDYTSLNITLKEDANVLDEVVVTSMGVKREKKALGYATQSLNGKVAGVEIAESDGAPGAVNNISIRGNSSISGMKNPLYIVDGKLIPSFDINSSNILKIDVLKGEKATSLYGEKAKNGVIIITTKSGQDKALSSVKARKNLQETAFFFPQLRTDKDGKVSFNFTAPEALTKWKLQLLAHTKELQSATKTLTTVTQKELMVFPNAPRFLREGDKIVFSAKISNLTNNKLSGIAQLQLTDPITGKEINTELRNTENVKNFTVDKDGNTNVSWNLSIPETVQAVQYKIVAKAGDFSDGEQNALPVLSNRMLVTETLPMWVRSNQTKTFTLDKLKNQTSTTLSHHKLTLEMTSNPAWYAVQALPYLMEYPYECAEQTFSRYYANTLASFIANSNPRIQEVFNSWKSSDALLSILEKNQELKSLIIQETPWIRDAQSETEQKKRIALLFDLNTMKNQQVKSINKLKDMQFSNGGFPWFKGNEYPNAFITNYIVSGFGHLNKLGVTKLDNATEKMLTKAIRFLDGEIVEQYQELLKRAAKIKAEKGQKKYEEYLKQNHLGYFALQYLYMRSFYADISLSKEAQKAVDYYKNQSTVYWNDFNLYGKGQIALIQFRSDNKKVAYKILKSLKENSITSDELGMYWKANVAGYYNYQAPIETQSLLIEAFSEIENDTKTIDNLKIWLLKNKQVSQWKTTKATSEAVYALLLNGSDWISVTDMVDIKVGDKNIDPTKLENVKVEAGTGYFKTSWNGSEIKPNMSEVTISKKGKGIAWGGLFWQYFEDLDKI